VLSAFATLADAPSPHSIKARTAQHIYTTEDREGAEFFGRNVLEFEGDLGKHADISDVYSPEAQKVLKKVFKWIGEDHWGRSKEAYQEFLDDIGNGDLYQKFASSQPQDSLINEILALGYDSIKIPDQMGGGRLGTSIVFKDPSRLKVLGGK